jgi:hypothetical protein
MWRTGCSSYRVASAVTLVAFALGCTTWKTQPVGPQQVVSEKRPEQVRVIQSNGAQVELWSPQISNDSLVGRLQRTTAPGSVEYRSRISRSCRSAA